MSIEARRRSLVGIRMNEKEKQEIAYDHHDFHPDPAVIARLRRKIDWHLLPLLSLMYLFSFLDRVNIGNAKVAGLEKDLNLSPSEYSWALSIFFIGYIIAEVPSQMLLKKVGPRKWISGCMFVWGTLTMLLAACKTAASLYATRFFLGIFEAALFPGAVFVISLFYSRGEQALRNGLFFSTATMAGAFGGILAYGIAQMDGVRGLHGWQWIFILEGLPTVLLCFVTIVYLPDYPQTAHFLSQDERDLAVKRLLVDAGPATQEEFSWGQFRSVFVDWKVYMHAFPYILTMTPLYALALFLPSLVREFSFDPITSQLMTAPAYAVACLATILVAVSSDHHRERGLHYAMPTLFAIFGYILLIVLEHKSAAVRYFGLTVAVTGVFSAVPSMVAWVSSNFGGHTKRAVATGVIISFGNCGGLISGHIYQQGQTTRGHIISLAMLGVSFFLILLLKFLYTRENRRRKNLTPEEFEKESQGEDLCDWHPAFVYIS
ncbi:MAG: major facilitator superfamily domain-containing protein [Linnemannia gamsii]|nr:MAG: major facilitator superfamily domain-containing protein [Linnemannia gamsii]